MHSAALSGERNSVVGGNLQRVATTELHRVAQEEARTDRFFEVVCWPRPVCTRHVVPADEAWSVCVSSARGIETQREEGFDHEGKGSSRMTPRMDEDELVQWRYGKDVT